MRQKYGLIIGVIFLIGHAWPQPALAQQESGPVVLEAAAQGLSLTWILPDYNLTTVEFEGQLYSQLRLPGLTSAGQPGAPELPFYSGLIGLPPTGGAHLHLSEVEREVVSLPHPVWPAPTPQPVFFADSSTPPTGGSTSRRPDPAIYTINNFYPSHIAELGPVEQMRNHRLVRLVIRPLRVNPVSGQMEIIRRLRLDITFDQPGPALNGLSSQAGSSPFDRALAASLINPQAGQWTVPRPTPDLSAVSVSAPAGADTFKITVSTPGLYVLTYNDLLAAGLPVATLDPRTLRVRHGWPRQEVAIWIEGENDGVFNPGDRLLFYAEPVFSRFVNYDVYFLSYGEPGLGLRMDSRSANPTGLPPGVAWRMATAETNQFYEPYYQGRDGDYWYWDNLRRPDLAAATYALPVEAPLTSGPAVTLTLWLQSYTDPLQDPDHRLAISLNNTALGERTWNGSQALTVTLTAPASLLVNGTNQVGLSLPGLSGVTVEGTWFDALSLMYPTGQAGAGQLIFQGEAGKKAYTLTQWPEDYLHIFDITDPANPRHLNDSLVSAQSGKYTLTLGDAGSDAARYLVAPNSRLKSPQAITPLLVLSDPPQGADYIIITHANFAAAVAPLAAHRAGQGLRVATVDVQAIYDTFGEGRMAPVAIKNFLLHAYTTWPSPAPTYVLLVGDGSYDFKNYSGYNPSTYIPPYLAHVDPWWGETASDHQFVTLSGDALPDLLIGRLAVNTPAQAATVVDKIIHYETNPTPGEWNARQLFVADNDEPADNLYFHADSDLGYNQVNPPFTGQRFYYSDSAGDPTYIYTDPNALRSVLLNNINYGANLITFNGHSSWLQWAQEGILRYYPPPYAGPNDLASLHNQYRLPVVLEMTCFTGSFHRPEVATLDESLLNLSGGGAVAVWGSTGLGISTGHASLQHGFYQAAYTEGKTKLGAATLAGQMELYATGLHQDLLDTFMLFGDPALTINLTITPLPNRVYLPVIFR